MSDAGNWSYTAIATHWPKAGRGDWSGADQWGAPVAFDCGYRFKMRTANDAKGKESMTRLTLWTEYPGAKQGDRIAIGRFTSPAPVVGACEVLTVTADPDAFGDGAPDYTIETV